MLSIENFYWILFDNLLDPIGLDCWYYYPFGTKDHLSINEFKAEQVRQVIRVPEIEVRRAHHVLFHYDQEPLWTNDVGWQYDNIPLTWSNKIFKILANSEHSEHKRQVCRTRGMVDWYFFFHGFAALDWFKDSQFVSTDVQPTKIFCTLNHQINKKRAYRLGIAARLFAKGLDSVGDISLHATKNDIQTEIDDCYSPLTDLDRRLIIKHLLPQQGLPLCVDRTDVDPRFSAHFGHLELKLWQKSFVHIVNETVFYDAKLHLTEKIFKPIVSLRPFVLAAAPGNLAYLRSYGFQTFDRWWDESYDLVEDTDRRSDMIAAVIEKLCCMSGDQLIKIKEEMQPVLEFNKQHFFGKFREIIVGELVDNFDTCLRIWNNGRFDGRQFPLHLNLESVKQALLR